MGFDDMLALHWEETEADDAPPMAPDWPTYYDLERRGVLKFFAMIHEHDQMIGYSIWFVQSTLHHRHLWAMNDMVYVEPEHRPGWAGVQLIRHCERALRELGVRRITYYVKPLKADGDLGYKRGRDSVAKLLDRLGYRLVEEAWAKAV